MLLNLLDGKKHPSRFVARKLDLTIRTFTEVGLFSRYELEVIFLNVRKTVL